LKRRAESFAQQRNLNKLRICEANKIGHKKVLVSMSPRSATAQILKQTPFSVRTPSTQGHGESYQ